MAHSLPKPGSICGKASRSIFARIEITVQLPHAQILGVEQQQVDVLAFENGLWNRISGQDVQSELSVLPELAWKKAAESELPAEAEQTLQQQLEQRIHTAQPLRLVFKDEKKSE